jgi:uncharacterized protein YcsI (UPF0317 family)
MDKGSLKPSEARMIFRKEQYTGITAGWCRGYTQAGLVVLPKEDAYDFLLFCIRNPKPCPVLDVTEVGSSEPKLVAPNADIRFDLPRYRVYKNGVVVDEPKNIAAYWNDSMVAFLIGCSFSFEDALLKAGIPLKHLEDGTNTGVYNTSIECRSAGRFSGNMVVSMRPIPGRLVSRTVTITSQLPSVHGAPVHIGDPRVIGIRDLYKPEWGDPPRMDPGDVPVFWACSVTPQVVALNSKPKIMITHLSANMFITDIPTESFSIF